MNVSGYGPDTRKRAWTRHINAKKTDAKTRPYEIDGAAARIRGKKYIVQTAQPAMFGRMGNTLGPDEHETTTQADHCQYNIENRYRGIVPRTIEKQIKY